MCLGWVCLGSSCLEFLVLPVHGYVFFFRLWMLSAIIPLDTFLMPFSLSSSGTLIILMHICLMLFRTSVKLFLFNKTCISFCCSDWVIPIILYPDYLCIFLYHLVCYSVLLVCSYFQLLNSSFLFLKFIFNWRIFVPLCLVAAPNLVRAGPDSTLLEHKPELALFSLCFPLPCLRGLECWIACLFRLSSKVIYLSVKCFSCCWASCMSLL